MLFCVFLVSLPARTLLAQYCPTPTITSISPTPWHAGKTYTIDIVGTNFATSQNPAALCTSTSVAAVVAQGTVDVSNVTVVSSTEVIAAVAVGSPDPTENACVSVAIQEVLLRPNQRAQTSDGGESNTSNGLTSEGDSADAGTMEQVGASAASTCAATSDFEAVKTVQILGSRNDTCAAALSTAGQTPEALARANRSWNQIASAAAAHNIDPRLLAAIGIRETGFLNLSEEDGAGVGVGVFQITVSPSSGVTASQASDLSWAADYAASLLASNMNYLSQQFPDFTPSQLLQAMAASYNMNPYKPGNFTGNPDTIDQGTAHNNYGSNVVSLMSCFGR